MSVIDINNEVIKNLVMANKVYQEIIDKKQGEFEEMESYAHGLELKIGKLNDDHSVWVQKYLKIDSDNKSLKEANRILIRNKRKLEDRINQLEVEMNLLDNSNKKMKEQLN